MRKIMIEIKNTKPLLVAGLIVASVIAVAQFVNWPVQAAPAIQEHDEHGEEHEEVTSIEMSAEERAQNGVVTSIVSERTLSEMILVPGEVRNNQYTSSQITSRIDAQILERHVKMGDFVEKGQLLLTLSSVDVGEAQADLILAQREWQRVQKLGKDIVSEQRYLEAEIQAQQALARILAYGVPREQANALMKSNDASLASGQFTVHAIQSGTVTSDDFVVGQFVEAGRPLMSIVDESSIWVEAQVSPREAARLNVGTDAVIELDGRFIYGTVVQVHHDIDEGSRTKAVRVEFENKNDEFHSGEFVNISIQSNAEHEALAIPRSSIILLEGKSVVFAVDGDEIHPVEIETGAAFGEWTQVLFGISAGDVIVVENTFLLKSLMLKSRIGDDH